MAAPTTTTFGTYYVIPKNEMTLTDMKQMRENAIQGALSRAADKLQVSESELLVRGAENILDFGTTLDQWNTAPLAVVGTAYSLLQAVAAPTLANNKLLVFYRIGIETTPLPVSLLRFRSGGSNGNIKAEFDLEQLVNNQETIGYFSQVVPVDPTETFAVQAVCRIATGIAARVQLGAFIVEPKGQLIASM